MSGVLLSVPSPLTALSSEERQLRPEGRSLLGRERGRFCWSRTQSTPFSNPFLWLRLGKGSNSPEFHT